IDGKGKGKQISGIPDDVELFEVFWGQIEGLVNARPEFSIQDVIALLNSLLNLSLNCYPDRLDHIDHVLGFAYQKVVEAQQANIPELYNSQTTTLQLQLLLNPIYAYGTNILTILKFPSCNATAITGNYGALLSLQPFATRRQVAHTLARTAIKQFANGFTIDSVVGVHAVFGELCGAMVRDQNDGGVWGEKEGSGERLEWDDVVEEQELVAKLVHLIGGDLEFDKEFELLDAARKEFEFGGDVRIRFTVPPLVFASIKLIRKCRLAADESLPVKISEIYEFIRTTINSLRLAIDYPSDRIDQVKKPAISHVGPPEMAVRLYIAAAQSADECGYEEIAYEFFSDALSAYEEAVAATPSQIATITLAKSALYSSNVFNSENYAALASKCIVFTSRLVRRVDQAHEIAISAHLYWVDDDNVVIDKSVAPNILKQGNGDAEGDSEINVADVINEVASSEKADILVGGRSEPPFRDEAKVLEMLQRALKIADAVRERHVALDLFVDILERYIWFYENGNDKITATYVNSLISLIQKTLIGLVESLQGTIPTVSTHSYFTIQQLAQEPHGVFGEDVAAVRRTVEEAGRHFRNVLDYVRIKQEEGGRWAFVQFSL
ncbi:Vacuolar protein sorting-associated protein 35, partial [Nowakowskiella sp. JEL0078]